MQGHNTLCLCSAEIQTALTHYLNTRVLREGHAVTVTRVSLDQERCGVQTFQLDIEPAEDRPAV